MDDLINKKLIKNTYDFIRLRLNTQWNDVLLSLNNCALIRELHVYGIHTNIGKKTIGSTQHSGLGTKLLKKAESVAYNNGFLNIAVISGVGVRNYYRKKGYILGENDYMYKNLKYKIIYDNYNIIVFIIRIFIIIISIIFITLYYK